MRCGAQEPTGTAKVLAAAAAESADADEGGGSGEQWMEVLHALCEERPGSVPDCEFFINKRDYPHLKVNADAGVAVEPYGFIFNHDDRNPGADIALDREEHSSYAPIMSFYCATPDRFADLPFPSSEDWEAATGLIFPPTFKRESDRRTGERKFTQTPRDLFTESNFRKFDKPWEEKRPTALFRGTATGGGITEDTNQRLKAAALSHRWLRQSNHEKKVDGTYEPPPLLDAAITGWNKRDKKTHMGVMNCIAHKNFPFDGGKQMYVPIYEQSAYKYLLYIDGHCAACRYAFMMRLGSVILKVESRIVADRMWYFPLLRPWVDHVPIAPDLSDLAEKIEWCRAHDDECRAIAEAAKQIYNQYVHKAGILDYLEAVTHEIAKRWEYPPGWWQRAAPLSEPPNISFAGPSTYSCVTRPCDQHTSKHCLRCLEEREHDDIHLKEAAAIIRDEEVSSAGVELRRSAPVLSSLQPKKKKRVMKPKKKSSGEGPKRRGGPP